MHCHFDPRIGIHRVPEFLVDLPKQFMILRGSLAKPSSIAGPKFVGDSNEEMGRGVSGINVGQGSINRLPHILKARAIPKMKYGASLLFAMDADSSMLCVTEVRLLCIRPMGLDVKSL